MKLSVIIPCYNEVDTIESLLQAVRRAPVEQMELVVVDDGSTDGTREILQVLAQRNDPDLRILFHRANQGKGAALRTGFQAASGDICIVQDLSLIHI